MAALSPVQGACCQVDFEGCIGKYDGSHVPAICHQARQPAETVLEVQQGLSYLGVCRHFRGGHAGRFAADGL